MLHSSKYVINSEQIRLHQKERSSRRQEVEAEEGPLSQARALI